MRLHFLIIIFPPLFPQPRPIFTFPRVDTLEQSLGLLDEYDVTPINEQRYISTH